MKVSEVADLADTTVRTIRHYHQLGLLGIPPVVGGIRDYGLDHVARLLRIRWLVSSGMSLPAIAGVLPPAGPPAADTVVGELTDALSDIDQHIEILQTKRTRVTALIERARRGEDAELSNLYRRVDETWLVRFRAGTDPLASGGTR